MAMRNVARFVFGLNRLRLRALNDDFTRSTIDRIIGGTGPFDFSGYATPEAIPLTIKFDNLAESTVNVDLSAGVVSLAAVTVDELVTRVNLAAPTDMLASKEIATSRFMLAYDSSDDPDVIQVYGAFAKYARIGQGFGTKYLKSNTMISFSESPTVKEDEVIEIAPASGNVIDVTIEGYKKGFAGTLVDSAEDFQIIELVEGGFIDANGAYFDPDEDSARTLFEMEIFSPVYVDGSNLEPDIDSWEQIIYQKCSGSIGERVKEKNFMRINYAIKGTSHIDNTGVRTGAIIRKPLSIAQWTALDFDNV